MLSRQCLIWCSVRDDPEDLLFESSEKKPKKHPWGERRGEVLCGCRIQCNRGCQIAVVYAILKHITPVAIWKSKMPGHKSKYSTFASMQGVLKVKRPDLTLVTTAAAYNGMLATLDFPKLSLIKIEMKNAEGKIVSGTIQKFVRGQHLNRTSAETSKELNRRKELGKSVRDLEAKSLQDLGALLGNVRKEGVSLVDLTREIEIGAADGYPFQTGGICRCSGEVCKQATKECVFTWRVE